MTIHSVPVSAFADNRPGTLGLRKKVAVFCRPGHVGAFIQLLLDVLPEAGGSGVTGKTLLIGGDGRIFNDTAIQTIIRMAAHGVARLLVGRDGLLSTPAVSMLIRRRGAFGGIILSVGHDPGAPDGRRFGEFEVIEADVFADTDSVDRLLAARQGIRIAFANEARTIYWLSGTGTGGATLRVCLERFEPDPARLRIAAGAALAPLAAVAAEIADVAAIAGCSHPSLIV